MSDSSNLLLLAFAAGVTAYVVINWDKLQKSAPVADQPMPQNPSLHPPIEISASRNNPMMPPAASAAPAPIDLRDVYAARIRNMGLTGTTFLG